MMLIFNKIMKKNMTKKTKKYNGWSKAQYGSMLSKEQHQANDDWFDEKLKIAKIVCVPELGMCWDRDMNKTEMVELGNGNCYVINSEVYDFIFAMREANDDWFVLASDMVGTVGANQDE
jgi:hypothetical protein